MSRLIWIFPLLILTSLNLYAEAVFRVASPQDTYPPFFVQNKDGQITGAAIDPLVQALQKLNITLQVAPLPTLRGEISFEEGGVHANFRSKAWIRDPERYLWLDLGVWLEDVLIYREDLPNPPKSLNDLHDSEIITHLGYVYPALELAFQEKRAVRLDRLSERQMINALFQAPVASQRMLLINKHVWDWYKQDMLLPDVPIHQSSFLVGCTKLELQLKKTPEMEQLLSQLQPVFRKQTKLAGPSPCQAKADLHLAEKAQ